MDDLKGEKKMETKLKCMECGHKFTKKLIDDSFEIECPKCHGFDVDFGLSVEEQFPEFLN